MSESSLPRVPPLLWAAGAPLALALSFALMVPPASAQSQSERQQRARELYQEGQGYANQGDWERATETWLKAYEAHPEPLILFNIGQGYRKQGDCESALFFYERYLMEDAESQYSEVASEHVENLEAQCDPESPWDESDPEGSEEAEDPEDPEDPEGEESEPSQDMDERAEDDDSGAGELDKDAPREPAGSGPASPTMLTLFADAGPAFVSMGDYETTLTSIRAGASYSLDAGPVEFQPGAVTTFTPVPWSGGGESGTALLTSMVASGAARYPLADRFYVRGELGLGVLVFSGVADAGNVFLEEGVTVTGALGIFHMRGQLAAEYEVTSNLALTLSPLAFSYSPHRNGLSQDIDSITRLEILAGVAFRL